MAAVQKKISCKNLHSYLTHLPSNVLDRLYDHPATCLAVMRQLPVLGRHYVMRVLFVDQPVPQAVVSSWVVNPGSGSEVVKVLSSLRIFNNTVIPGGLPGWILNPKFKENLRVALLGGGSAWAGSGMALGPDKHAKEVSFLDNYAMERWECVLHFMVGSKETTEGVSRDVVEILLYAKLMKPDAGGGPPVISPSGFQFLLMDSSTQIWFFMLQYLETVERRGMNLVECLSFLFQLSFSTFGNDYCTDGMSDTQFKFLQNLREFGLVYQRKRKSHRYYPTRLAINLASGMSQMSTESARPGYIVVETNYRIYSYTDSPLQVALIALFSEMLYRFPNMCVSNLTRESVRQALVMGITAEQIINFLRSHAHPQQLKQTPVLPPTITDQIRLWELERDRFRFNDGVLYNQFNSVQDYELLRDYAQDQGVLVWGNVNRRAMVVMKNGHDDVKKFWKRHRPQS